MQSAYGVKLYYSNFFGYLSHCFSAHPGIPNVPNPNDNGKSFSSGNKNGCNCELLRFSSTTVNVLHPKSPITCFPTENCLLLLSTTLEALQLVPNFRGIEIIIVFLTWQLVVRCKRLLLYSALLQLVM